MENSVDILSVLKQRPQASAQIRGSRDYPDINGRIYFYQHRNGVIVVTQVYGLPQPSGECSSPVFGFHIHSGGSCSGNDKDYFADALMHYNPNTCLHPHHAGDMPPLFGCDGFAFLAFFTDRFTVKEIIGKTVIIHSHPDDFKSQPAGNSGTRIACGVIKGI